MDPTTATHSVQLAVAPVFFLTAVAGMIGAVAGRLARIIDRARTMEERVRNSQDEAFIARALHELSALRTRGHLANISIGLLTLCGFFIGLTIVGLFISRAWMEQGSHWAVIFFLSGVGCFIAALGCFLYETVLSTQLLNFSVLQANIQRRPGADEAA